MVGADDHVLVHSPTHLAGVEIEAAECLVEPGDGEPLSGRADLVHHAFDHEVALVDAVTPVAVVAIARSDVQVDRAQGRVLDPDA